MNTNTTAIKALRRKKNQIALVTPQYSNSLIHVNRPENVKLTALIHLYESAKIYFQSDSIAIARNAVIYDSTNSFLITPVSALRIFRIAERRSDDTTSLSLTQYCFHRICSQERSRSMLIEIMLEYEAWRIRTTYRYVSQWKLGLNTE